MLSKIRQELDGVFEQIANLSINHNVNVEQIISKNKQLLQEIQHNISSILLQQESYYKYRLAKAISKLRKISDEIEDLYLSSSIQSNYNSKISKKRNSHFLFMSPKQITMSKLSKFRKQIYEELNQLTQFIEDIDKIEIIEKENKYEIQELDLSRLAIIYKNEVEHLNKLFSQDSTSKRHYTQFSQIIDDVNLKFITQISLSQADLIQNIQNYIEELQESVFMCEQESTNFENQSSFDFSQLRSKTQTLEGSENDRARILKEISNKVQEPSTDTCIKCNIF